MNSSPSTPPYWTAIHGPLSELSTTLINRVDRDKRAELEARAVGMRTWLLGHLRVAQRTYEVIEALAKERESIPLGLEVAVALPPLARVLLESVFSVTYVFEHPSTRLPDFWKGAWAKIAEQYQQYLEDHGTDPTWQPTLAGLLKERDGWRDDLAKQGTPLTPAQLADWKQVRWPNPGKMVRRTTDAWRRDVLGYLDARYYGPLSIAAHLSGTGLLAQAGHLLPSATDENQRIYFGQQFAIAFTMYIALISQLALDAIVEGAFARRVVALWTYSGMPDSATDVYSHCYKQRLEILAAT